MISFSISIVIICIIQQISTINQDSPSTNDNSSQEEMPVLSNSMLKLLHWADFI